MKLFCGNDFVLRPEERHKDLFWLKDHVARCEDCRNGVSMVMGMFSSGKASRKKAIAARENGRRGGRPRKENK
jgi:hypothetical protein